MTVDGAILLQIVMVTIFCVTGPYILVNTLAGTRARVLQLPSSRRWKMREGCSLLQVQTCLLV